MPSHTSRFSKILRAQEQVNNPYLLCWMVARRVRQLTEAASVRDVRKAIDLALEEVGAGQLTLLDPAVADQGPKQRKPERSSEAVTERAPREAAEIET